LLLTSELTSDAVRCCSSCFNRVVRMINSAQSTDTAECIDGTFSRHVTYFFLSFLCFDAVGWVMEKRLTVKCNDVVMFRPKSSFQRLAN